jgi:hypothetical protein
VKEKTPYRTAITVTMSQSCLHIFPCRSGINRFGRLSHDEVDLFLRLFRGGFMSIRYARKNHVTNIMSEIGNISARMLNSCETEVKFLTFCYRNLYRQATARQHIRYSDKSTPPTL